MADQRGTTAGEAGTDVQLLGAAEVRELADRLDIRPSKQRGQNFVIDPNTIRRIVRLAELRDGDDVLEVGPGLGSLTLGLLAAGHRVLAVEVDAVLAGALMQTVQRHAPTRAADLTVVVADALTLDGPPLIPAAAGEAARGSAQPAALVANLPYNVAVPVLLHLLATFPTIARALVMVQAEVADRLAAEPGSRTYGIPSVKARWYGEVRRVATISRSVFWPVPNVDSALVRLTRGVPPPTTATRDEVFAVINAAFAQRRKTLRAALAPWAGSATAADAALRAAGIDPRARGESLTVEDFARIAEYSRDGSG
ncbi:MAG TPA: 16S rRNA (adenine(1518)-N(6)/adenine(1519)-N(6))-dimethyltransferase RsmA [Actinomycetes bacterium]|nr:16S rRNA (adenine(1518)-N(6)/adenine(1519)-N(6))-dimethyltransferase RsmA [Actinomycetes bacterium]